MKNFSHPLLVLILYFNIGYSQNTDSQNFIVNSIQNKVSFKTANFTDFPTYIEFNSNSDLTLNNLETWIKKTVKNNSIGIKFMNKSKDDLGFEHYRYQQTIFGIPVEHSMIIVHSRNGKIHSMNGDLFTKNLPNSVNKTLSFSKSLEKAKKHIRAKKYKWEIPAEEKFIKREQNSSLATFYPKKQLAFISKNGKQEGKLELTYKIDVYAHAPISRTEVFVNVSSGEVVHTNELIHEGDAVGAATTQYSGVQALITDSYLGSFRLRESGRGNGIETYNMQGGAVYGAAIDFTDADNNWNNVNANLDEYATDAHWGTEKVYDYFLNTHGRNSIDGAGFKLLNYVHHSVGANAYWDGTRMTYGDGDPARVTLSKPLTTIDVVGHEITHGLISNTANLVYSYESGALNESFADIFGVAVDFKTRPGVANWFMGEECSNSGVDHIRNMSDPNDNGHPDTYLGTNWYAGAADNGGVHTNSGVQNFWFYLLSEGGSGKNDIGNNYSVPGINITKAEKIAFRNLTVYLGINSQHVDARNYAIQSAKDLYGNCSIEVYATTEAWYAVGVGAQYANKFIVDKTGGWCSGDIVLTDNSNAAGPWQWFKDGDSLIGQNSKSINISTGGFGAGVYTLSNSNGGSCKFASFEVKTPTPLVADYTFNTSCAEHIVAFSDGSIGDSIISWSWNFGDGSTSSEQHPTHEYLITGNFAVSLTITDFENCTSTKIYNLPILRPTPLILDPLCECDPSSLIPNHSFEDTNCCPKNYSQMNCAKTWIQASAATSDYYNTCGFTNGAAFSPPPMPIPNGDGYVGFIDQSRGAAYVYKEYVGACLSNTMLAGKNYIMEFYISHGSGNTTMDIALFGSPVCADLPFGGAGYYDCPTNDATTGYMLLNTQVVVLGAGAWSKVTMNFTPLVNINAIVLGPKCGRTAVPAGVSYNYYYLDDLQLSSDLKVEVDSVGHLCQDNLVLGARPFKPGGYYIWYKDGVELVGEKDSVLNVSAKNYGPGKYTLMYVMRDKCSFVEVDLSSFYPEADFDATDICLGETSIFTDKSTIDKGKIDKWLWDFNTQSSTNQNPNLILSTVGKLNVKLKVVSDLGCEDEITKEIEVFPLPTMDFDMTRIDQSVLNTKTCFTNLSVNSTSYLWNFDFDGLTSDRKEPGCINFPDRQGGVYTVCLKGVTDKGCVDSICKEIKIKEDNSVYVPNSFTPNGDNINDNLLPIFFNPNFIKTYTFSVYNRWGQQIYSTNSVNNGWDGLHKGVKAKTDTYVWNISFKDKDGNAKELTGHVLLLK